MRLWNILLILQLLQDLQMTKCLHFNMRVLDYTFMCSGGGLTCRRFISTKIQFMDSRSRGCAGYARHAYDCICCEIDTCRPKTCSCLHGRFSSDTDSKLISNKTQDTETTATIRIAVHEKNEWTNAYEPKSEFCTELILSPDERTQQKQIHPSWRSPDHEGTITLEFKITSDIVTTASTSEPSTASATEPSTALTSESSTALTLEPSTVPYTEPKATSTISKSSSTSSTSSSTSSTSSSTSSTSSSTTSTTSTTMKTTATPNIFAESFRSNTRTKGAPGSTVFPIHQQNINLVSQIKTSKAEANEFMQTINIPSIIGGIVAVVFTISAAVVLYKWCQVRKENLHRLETRTRRQQRGRVRRGRKIGIE